MLRNKSIFISGGTGSFGSAFVKNVIKKYKKVKRIVIFSRDEFKQYEMSKIFPIKKYPFIRYFLGDIRLKEASRIICSPFLRLVNLLIRSIDMLTA